MFSKKRNRSLDSLEDDSFIDDEEYVDETSPYFKVDSKPLQEELSISLSSKLNIDISKVSNVISEVFDDISDYMIDDYLPVKPNNKASNKWKLGKDKKKIKKIENELSELRKELDDEVPTIEKIVNAAITKRDKKVCLKLFDQLNSIEPYTSDYFKLIDNINNILIKADSKNYKQVLDLEKEEERLRKLIVVPDNLKNRILKLNADEIVRAKLLAQYEEMMSYPPDSSLHIGLREEIEWGLKMPFQKAEIPKKMNNSQLNKYYCKLRSDMDKELYGMDKVKERILHILNDRYTSNNSCGRNLALVGPPGVGKTLIVKVLGKILNKKYAIISAGALDSAALKGANKVWQGSEPSIILQKMSELGTNDPIIGLDEIDKLGDTPQGKLSQHALLHISDPDHNKEFQDNFLKNYSHDLSKIFFIYMMNDDKCLDSALRDRLDIIYLTDYWEDEKKIIIKNYMLPDSLKIVGMKSSDVVFTEKAIEKILGNGNNLSLRNVKNIIRHIVGKVNMYRTASLKKGSISKFISGYEIKNFKLPLKIDEKLVVELTKDL